MMDSEGAGSAMVAASDWQLLQSGELEVRLSYQVGAGKTLPLQCNLKARQEHVAHQEHGPGFKGCTTVSSWALR
jgi:hypothetical protein